VTTAISTETLAGIDALLNTEEILDPEPTQLKQSDFNNLKTDPGRINDLNPYPVWSFLLLSPFVEKFSFSPRTDN
jgi:hypothetical protein